MARVNVWVSGGTPIVPWAIALYVIYGVLFFITAVLATLFAYEGNTPYEQMPEKYRNHRWMKLLLLVIFILFLALLWPVIMVGVPLLVICALISNKDASIWKGLRRKHAKKDEETGQGAEDSVLNSQASSEYSPSATTTQNQNTTISEPPPAYTPYATRRGQPEEPAC